jgi:hypothetical protein
VRLSRLRSAHVPSPSLGPLPVACQTQWDATGIRTNGTLWQPGRSAADSAVCALWQSPRGPGASESGARRRRGRDSDLARRAQARPGLPLTELAASVPVPRGQPQADCKRVASPMPACQWGRVPRRASESRPACVRARVLARPPPAGRHFQPPLASVTRGRARHATKLPQIGPLVWPHPPPAICHWQCY